ncbi:hypothetical protein DPH57_17120 [Massilia sp. YMA4]|nr:hypothetical protein DPH57_17120 [Massilia sp. YMA4]
MNHKIDALTQLWQIGRVRIVCMTGDTHKDERQAQRRVLRVSAAVVLPGHEICYGVRTENVSSSGLAVRMPRALAIGTKIDLTFVLATSAGPIPISLTAAVVHTMLSGDSWLTGVSILKIADQHRAIIGAYCAGRH